MATHIDAITLEQALPAVFADSIDGYRGDSEVWMRTVSFLRGQYYLIRAASGTGKSSLCSYIYGDRRDYKGHILFDTRDIASLSVSDWCALRRHNLAYLPQEIHLFPELTAIENIGIKNRLTGYRTRHQILEMLDELGLADRADTPARRLSVGQQQRVAIVRALCQPFDFLLIDEPVSHLDPLNNRTVSEMIMRETRQCGGAVIATSVGNDIIMPHDTTVLNL